MPKLMAERSASSYHSRGYALARQLRAQGYLCEVIAPNKMVRSIA
jgi:hypothetical protein